MLIARVETNVLFYVPCGGHHAGALALTAQRACAPSAGSATGSATADCALDSLAPKKSTYW